MEKIDYPNPNFDMASCLNGLSVREKLGQFFFQIDLLPSKQEFLDSLDSFHPSGFLSPPQTALAQQSAHWAAQEKSKVPFLIAADLSGGGKGIVAEGSSLPSFQEIIIENHPSKAYHLGLISSREAKIVGCHIVFPASLDKTLITKDRSNTLSQALINYAKGIKDCGLLPMLDLDTAFILAPFISEATFQDLFDAYPLAKQTKKTAYPFYPGAIFLDLSQKDVTHDTLLEIAKEGKFINIIGKLPSSGNIFTKTSEMFSNNQILIKHLDASIKKILLLKDRMGLFFKKANGNLIPDQENIMMIGHWEDLQK